MRIVNLGSAATLQTRHGSVIRPLVDRTTSDITQCSLAEELLPPGHSVTPHYHATTEEIYYVLEGAGVMRVGDETAEVGPGDAIYIPKGSVHTLANTGETPMRIVLVCGPAFSRDDERFGRVEHVRPALAQCARHVLGIRVTGQCEEAILPDHVRRPEEVADVADVARHEAVVLRAAAEP